MTDPPHSLRASVLLVVALGGAAGAAARWQLGSWFPSDPTTFPWTTFAINLTGAVLLALLTASGVARRHALLHPALGTGVLGGFTTLSAYSEETRALLASGETVTATAYLLGTLVACLAGVALVERFSTGAARGRLAVEEGDR